MFYATCLGFEKFPKDLDWRCRIVRQCMYIIRPEAKELKSSGLAFGERAA